MRIFTNSQVADMDRRFRILQRDLHDVRVEKAALAARLRAAEDRADRAEKAREKAVLYVGIALGAVVDMASEAG